MMILTCPNCATRFFVERDSIGPAGRRVKCSACATEWVAYRADEDAEPADEGAAPPPEPAVDETLPQLEPLLRPTERQEPSPRPEDSAVVEPDHVPEQTGAPVAEPQEAEEVYAWTVSRDAADQEAEIEPTPPPETAIASEPMAEAAPVEEAAAAPLFTERAATRPPRSRMPLLLLLLLLVLAAVGALTYYRAHRSEPPAPATAPVALRPGAGGG